MKVNLLGLMLDAPLVGVRKRWPNILHAVEMEGLPIKTWPEGLATSVCGLKGLRILGDGMDGVALWPPYVKNKSLEPRKRCSKCFQGASKKRPRSEFVRAQRKREEEKE